jgi:hypothetical protein
MSAGERIPSNTRVAVGVSEEADVVILVCSFFLGARRWFLLRGRLEILYHRFARIVTSNDLDPLLGAGQAFLANLHELHPFLVTDYQFLEHHFARLHLLDDFLEPIHGAFKIQLRLGLFRGGRHVTGNKAPAGLDKKRDFCGDRVFDRPGFAGGAIAKNTRNEVMDRSNSCSFFTTQIDRHLGLAETLLRRDIHQK